MTAVSSSLPLTEKTASMKRSKTLTLPHLPLDLVSEILCRLSVKHLLQLCCVCKSWNSLISLDSNFARKQLSLSTSNKDRHHLIQSSTKSYQKESYQKLSLTFFGTHFETPIALGALSGCLSILSLRGEISKLFNVWIMKEYGNEKSWTKLLSVPHSRGCGFYSGYWKVLYISENNQLLMEFYRMTKRGLVVYDSINKTFTIPKMQNNNHDLRVTSNFYVESLISPF
ncbi:F-box/kelch-repeat protein At3g23880-like [Vicia villosa]|uniref:F-box/kelch-repeat protein At3g23880-like n=1 Tax=Vicia villosa TaxID=3911 RepID=UPI00273AAD3E|nr:F-box/kelch-repeat protein At3g23880-like [Vicia villosa]